jgi:hypothetical protein
VPPAVPERQMKGLPAQASMEEPVQEEELFDTECLNLINEYFFGIRIFPGQDPSHVFVGWVTTQYHFHSTTFSNANVRTVTIAAIDEFDGELFRYIPS